MAKNEVATTEKNFNLVTLTGELKEAVAEELGWSRHSFI